MVSAAPFSAGTKPVDIVQHPIQHRFGSRGWNACSLQLPDLTRRELADHLSDPDAPKPMALSPALA
jgi:hypothetical protein